MFKTDELTQCDDGRWRVTKAAAIARRERGETVTPGQCIPRHRIDFGAAPAPETPQAPSERQDAIPAAPETPQAPPERQDAIPAAPETPQAPPERQDAIPAAPTDLGVSGPLPMGAPLPGCQHCAATHPPTCPACQHAVPPPLDGPAARGIAELWLGLVAGLATGASRIPALAERGVPPIPFVPPSDPELEAAARYLATVAPRYVPSSAAYGDLAGLFAVTAHAVTARLELAQSQAQAQAQSQEHAA